MLCVIKCNKQWQNCVLLSSMLKFWGFDLELQCINTCTPKTVLFDCLYGKIFKAHPIHRHTNFNQEKGRFVKAVFSIVAKLCEKRNGKCLGYSLFTLSERDYENWFFHCSMVSKYDLVNYTDYTMVSCTMVLRLEQPQQDQNPWFISLRETTSIADLFILECPCAVLEISARPLANASVKIVSKYKSEVDQNKKG